MLKLTVVCLLSSLAVEKALFDVHGISQQHHTALTRGQDHIECSCFYKNLNQSLKGILKITLVSSNLFSIRPRLLVPSEEVQWRKTFYPYGVSVTSQHRKIHM